MRINPVRTVIGRHLGESAKAIKFRIEEISGEGPILTPIETWFPFSQTSRIIRKSLANIEEKDSLVVTEWILEQKDLINTEKSERHYVRESDRQIKEAYHEASPSDSYSSDFDNDIPF